MAARSILEGIAEDAAAPIGHIGARLLVKGAFVASAVAAFCVAVIFFTWALYIVVEQWAGKLGALTVIGALFLVAGAALAASAAVRGRGQESQPEPTPSVQAGAISLGHSEALEKARTVPEAPPVAGAGAGDTMTAQTLDRLAIPLLDFMREQGMERERLALAAGVAVAKDMRPWMLVGVVLAVGFVIGQLTRHRFGLHGPIGSRS